MAVYYVDGDNGDDGNSGLSEALAVKTIQAAVDLVSEDSSIYVQNNVGTNGYDTIYNEAVDLAIAGATMCDIHLAGYGASILDCVKPVIDSGSSSTCIEYDNGASTHSGTASVSIANFVLRRSGTYGAMISGGGYTMDYLETNESINSV